MKVAPKTVRASGPTFGVLVALVLAVTSVRATTLGSSVDLIRTYGSLQTTTDVRYAGAGTLTRQLPPQAFIFVDSLADARQSPGAPEPSYARASGAAAIEAGTGLDPVTGDILLFGVVDGRADAESVPFFDEYDCAYPYYALAEGIARYGVWFDLLEPMNYFLRVELTPGPTQDPNTYFEFNSLIRDRTLVSISGADGDGPSLLVVEDSGRLTDGYHELLSQVAQVVRVPGDNGELSSVASARIRYWLSLNPTTSPTPVPLPGTLIFLGSGLIMLRGVCRGRPSLKFSRTSGKNLQSIDSREDDG